MLYHMLSFIFGCCAYRFLLEKQWWCVFLMLLLEGLNLYSMNRSQDKDIFRAKVLRCCAYIYVLLGEEKLTEGMDESLKKEISKTMTEMAAATYGLNAVVPWMKEVTKFKKGLEDKK